MRQLADGVPLELAGLDFVVDHAPGHTRGSVDVRSAGTGDVPPVLLSGDVLFEGSMGRADLPGGDHQQMLRSLTTKVLPLADETVVLPGHGATTSIGRERAGNRSLLELARAGAAPAPPRAWSVTPLLTGVTVLAVDFPRFRPEIRRSGQ